MKMKNMGFTAVQLPLTGGRALTLPARGSVEISEEDFASPACQRLFAERRLIILPEPRRHGTETPPQPPA
jgi:hypothetical protein